MPSAVKAAQPEFSPLALKTLTAIAKFLGPHLAKDVKLDRGFMLGVTKRNFHTSRPSIVKAITKQVKPALAQDADLSGIHKLLDSLDPDAGKDAEEAGGVIAQPIPIKAGETKEQPSDVPGQGDEDPVHGHIREYLAGKMSDDDVNGLLEHLKGKKAEDMEATEEMSEAGGEGEDEEGGPPPFEGKPEVGKGPPAKDKHMGKDKKLGRDEVNAIVKAATDGVRKTVMAEQKALREAESFVLPWTGKLQGAFDSADAILRHALKTVGVKNADTIHSSALKTVLEAHPKPGERRESKSTTVAQDAKTLDSFKSMYGDVPLRVM